jgi:hypothetical protein
MDSLEKKNRLNQLDLKSLKNGARKDNKKNYLRN